MWNKLLLYRTSLRLHFATSSYTPVRARLILLVALGTWIAQRLLLGSPELGKWHSSGSFQRGGVVRIVTTRILFLSVGFLERTPIFSKF